MKNKKKKVVIRVSGGMVQEVFATDPDIKIVVEDEDIEEYNPAETENTSEMVQVY